MKLMDISVVFLWMEMFVVFFFPTYFQIVFVQSSSSLNISFLFTLADFLRRSRIKQLLYMKVKTKSNDLFWNFSEIANIHSFFSQNTMLFLVR